MRGRFERNPNLAWREIEGEVVIISPEDSHVHELNETASLVWKCADGTRSLEEIAARMAAEYDIAMDAARVDVREIIAVFEEKQLLLTPAGAKG